MRRKATRALIALLVFLVIPLTVLAAVHGDFNGDGKVGSQDAVYLLHHVLDPQGNPTDQSADANVDGKVNTEDALHLLRHSLSPEDYPLTVTHEATEIPEKAASCTENGLTAGSVCNVCQTVLQEQTVIPALGHSFADGVCTRCGIGNTSQNLQMELLPDGTGYAVIGVGQCTDAQIIVPDTYQGLPVTTVSSQAFSGSGIVSVTLGKYVLSIESCAFYECENLTQIIILAEDVIFGGSNIVHGCDALEIVCFAGDPVRWTRDGFYLEDNVQLELNYGHNYAGEILSESSCIAGGMTRYICRDCGRSYDQQTEAMGHSYAEEDLVEPTCTEDGSAEGACTRCGQIFREILPARGHNIASYTQQETPSCEHEGSEIGFCTECQQWIERAIPAVGHAVGAFAGTGEYCGTRELGHASCTVCGQTVYTVEHILHTSTQLPTCTEDGSSTEFCSNCTYCVSTPIPAAGHNAGQWEVGREATCTAEGEKIRKCTGCDVVVNTSVIPKGDHRFAATITDGVCTYTCRDCDYTETVATENKNTITLVTGCEPELPAVYAEEGQTPQLPTPVMDGYTFHGWYLDESGIAAYENTPVTADLTLYALWAPDEITVTDDGLPGVVHTDDTNYQFAVKSPVVLTNDNVGSYIMVTSSEKEPMDIFVASCEDGIYYIGGNYGAGDIYEAVAVGGVTFVESGSDPLWFVISGPERESVEVQDGTVKLPENQILSQYSNGDYDYVITREDLLDVGQMVVVTGDSDEDLRAIYEIVGESCRDGHFSYQCVIPSPDDVLSQTSVFSQEAVDFSNVVLQDGWEDMVVQSVRSSTAYAAFCETAAVYAETQSKNDPEYTYRPRSFKVEPKVKVERSSKTQRTELVILIEVSCALERVKNSTGAVVDVYTVSMTMERRFGADASVSANGIRRGDARVALTTHNTLTIDFVMRMGLMDNDDAQEAYFRNLYKNACGKKDLLPIDSIPDGRETQIPAFYLPIPLPLGFALDVEAYLVLDWEICGEFGVMFQHTNTMSFGFELKDWEFDIVGYSSNKLSVNVYLMGSMRASAGIRPEIGLNWAKIVRVGANTGVSAYAQSRGLVGFTAGTTQELKPLLAGYVECGLNLKARVFAEIGIWRFKLRSDVTLFNQDYPLLSWGVKELPLGFETDGEEYVVYMDYDAPVSLRDRVDLITRVQDLSSMEVERSVAKDSRFTLTAPQKNVQLDVEGALVIAGCDQTEFDLEIRITSGTVYKDITVHVIVDHQHEFTTTYHPGDCTNDERNFHQCGNCTYQYWEVITEAPGHDYRQFIVDKYPTCTESGSRHGTCARCDYTASETIPALKHDYSVQLPEEAHLRSAATCQKLASYFYVCANCGGHDGRYTYEYGQLGDHTYPDPYTCHDRACTTEGCTYVSAAATEHPWTEWFAIEPGGCAVQAYSIRACRDCGLTQTDPEVDHTQGHDMQLQPDLVPTCDQGGYTDYLVCTVCGSVANQTILEPLGHNILYRMATETTHVEYCHRRGCDYESEPISHAFGEWIQIVAPTCVTDGTELRDCVCGHEQMRPVRAEGHSYTGEETRKPTCTEAGVTTYTCGNCDDSYTEPIAPSGHKEGAPKKENEVHATCTEGGSYDAVVYCTACGQELSRETHFTEKKDHDHSGNWLSDGTRHYRICPDCSEILDAAEHDHSGAWQQEEGRHFRICPDCRLPIDQGDHIPVPGEPVPATCTEDGYTPYRCQECGHEWVGDEVKAEHQWSDDWLHNDDCHYHACTVCGETEPGSRQDHSRNSEVTKEPTCTEAGSRHVWCVTCGYERDEEIPADHDHSGVWQQGEAQHYRICGRCGEAIDHADHIPVPGKPVPVTCTEDGYTPYICKECGLDWIGDKVFSPGHRWSDDWSRNEDCHYHVCTACGETKPGSEQDHSRNSEVTKEPTCTEAGSRHIWCVTCGYESDEKIPADHDHSGAWQQGEEQHYRICGRCGEAIDHADHIPVPGEPVPATCTKDGYTPYRCQECGHEWDGDVVKAEHQWSDDWSCNEDCHYHACTVCREIEPGSKQGHSLGEQVTKEPGCTEDGILHIWCVTCGYERDEEIPADHDHSGDWLSDGTRHYRICPVCSQTIDAEEHKHEGALLHDEDQHYRICPDCKLYIDQGYHIPVPNGEPVPVTCTEDGYTPYRCRECGYTWEGDKVLSPGHQWSDDWVYDDDCHYHACTVCGEMRPGSEQGHSLTNEVTEEPTCTEDGILHIWCVTCGYESDENIPADHDHSGAWQQGEEQHYRICSRCSEAIDHTDHTMKDTTVDPDCENPGYDLHECTICRYSYQDTETDALGHSGMDVWQIDEETGEHFRACDRKDCDHEADRAAHTYGAWSTTKEPTCAEKGARQRICDVCGHLDPDELDTLPHDYYEDVETDEVPVTGGTQYLHSVVKKCHNCGYREIIGSTIVSIHEDIEILERVYPTCTEPGLTTGWKCAYPGCDDENHGLPQVEEPALGHDFVDGYCTRCGEQSESEGLAFKLSDTGTYYIVTGIGTCTDTELVIPAAHNGLPVKEIGAFAFGECSGLEAITIPEGVTAIGIAAFSRCSGLAQVTLPKGLTTIGDGAFGFCTSLRTIAIPQSMVTIGYWAFENCSSLEEITIPKGVTTIGDYAFQYCFGLTVVTMPESVTRIGTLAFLDCTALETIYFEGTQAQWDAVEKGSGWNDNCPAMVICLGEPAGSEGLEFALSDTGTYYIVTGIGTCTDTELVIPATHNGLPVKEIGELAFLDSELTSVTVPEGVTTIGECAFQYCESLVEIAIPEGVTTISGGAFFGCRSLAKVTLPESVTVIGESAFCWCRSLAKVTLPESVTVIGENAFFYCTSLVEITLPEGVTTIGDGAFRSCHSLMEITIPESVTTIGDYAFNGCSSLTEITIPAGVTTIGNAVFSGCISLVEITLPEGITAIGDYAFAGCFGLMKITILEGVTTIGECAFQYCESLVEIAIPESVTTIGDYAFNGCSSLTEITIPAGVTTIGDYAFCDCTALETLCFEGTKAQWDAISKGTDWNKNCTFTVICASGNSAFRQLPKYCERREML